MQNCWGKKLTKNWCQKSCRSCMMTKARCNMSVELHHTNGSSLSSNLAKIMICCPLIQATSILGIRYFDYQLRALCVKFWLRYPYWEFSVFWAEKLQNEFSATEHTQSHIYTVNLKSIFLVCMDGSNDFIPKPQNTFQMKIEGSVISFLLVILHEE